MPNDIAQLTDRDARKLIAQIKAKVEDVASLLCQLYHGKGWCALGYTSWRECCQEEFGKSASWACRQIRAAEVRQALPMATASGLPESHVRELAKVPEDDRANVYALAEENVGDPDKITAADIREAARQWSEPHEELAEHPEVPSMDEPEPEEPTVPRSQCDELAEIIQHWISLENVSPIIVAAWLESIAARLRKET